MRQTLIWPEAHRALTNAGHDYAASAVRARQRSMGSQRQTAAHWPEDQRDTTLGGLIIRMVAETAQHAGHADIIRELIDGKGGPDQDAFDESTWQEYIAQVQTAADTFAPGPEAHPQATGLAGD